MRCRLDNDRFEDLGVVYFVHSYEVNTNSTGVRLELEHPDGGYHTKVVASHQIEWIEDED
jgi:imidazoleglycerol phosphate synthase glutamine amidotransferase subunit HisH